MRILLLFGLYISLLVCQLKADTAASVDKLPEVETTLDGKFIITYPNSNNDEKSQNKTNPDIIAAATADIAPEERESLPVLISQTRSNEPKNYVKPAMPNPGPLNSYGHPSTRYKSINRDIKTSSESSTVADTTNDPDPDPFSSHRKIRPYVIPDAYAAAPIAKNQTTAAVLETISENQNDDNKPNVFDKVDEEVADSIFGETPTSKQAILINQNAKLPTNSENLSPEIIQPSKSLKHGQQNSFTHIPSNFPTKNSVPIQSSTKNETSAELIEKETFNAKDNDYDEDVFARLKDAVLIGDNPQSALSESIPRPSRVHPRKPKKKFSRRQFAAPSAGGDSGGEDEDLEIIPEATFPLPNCYRTAGGFLCCNRFLEELIYRSNTKVQQKQLSECNVHAFATTLQDEAEKVFKTTFEIIIGTGDFASKTRFKDNLICKTIVDKKVILIYGTPEPYSLTKPNTPLLSFS